VPFLKDKRLKMAKAALIVAASGALFSAAQLLAQDSVRTACMPDISKYCVAALATFTRKNIRTCLIKNIKKTSPACQEAARARRDDESAKKAGT
jgi:hypothetical protein